MLGRVTQATYTDGSIVQYQYDGNGNIVAINRLQASTLSISSFTPAIGQANSIVTITGAGFSPTPGDNAVTVGGAAAVVNSASVTQLVITVPMNGQTGTIGVTVAGNSTASAQQFVVRRPAITAFSPTIVNADATITLTGTNLALVSPAPTVTAGGQAATVTSFTNTKIVFKAPANGNGTVVVGTSYGQAVSTAALTVLPASVTAANVGAVAITSAGGASISVTNAQTGKQAVLAFDAIAGQRLTVQTSGHVSVPANVTPGFTLFSPSGAQVASGSIAASSPSLHLPVMPETGRYLMVFSPGSASYQFNAVVAINNVFANTSVGSASIATTANWQSERIWITGGAGQHVSIGLTNLTMSGASLVTATLYRPDGNVIWSRYCNTTDPASSCSISTGDLPSTGTYLLMVVPNGAATMSFNVTVSPPLTGSLDPGGTPLIMNLAQPAQFGVYTFTVTQGQAMALRLDSIVTTPANQRLVVRLKRPDGSEITAQNTTSVLMLNYSNLTAGTYRVDIAPEFGITATARLSLSVTTPPSLPLTGTATPGSTVLPGQVAYFNVSGTTGQGLGIGLRNLVLSTGSGNAVISVIRPDGVQLGSSNTCLPTDPNGGCNLWFVSLPQTGTYQVTVVPSGLATATFNLYASPPETVTPTSGMPATVNMSIPGQWGLLPFVSTGGQDALINLISLTTTPTNQNTALLVFDPNDNQLVNLSGTGARTYSMQNLVAGTYKVVLVPWYGVTASASVQVTWGAQVNQAVPTDGTTTHITTAVPGQNAYLTFPGTAGQPISIGLRNLVLSTGAGSASMTLSAPNGAAVGSGNTCYTSSPGAGCNFWWGSLPQTGTYKVTIVPNAQATMNFDFTVTPPVTLTPTSGTPTSLNLPVWGQWGLATFTTTAGNDAAVTLSAITTAPAGQQVSVLVYDSNWTQLAGSNSTGARSYNLSNLAAGTYKIAVIPWYGATATTTLQVDWAPKVTGTAPIDGTNTHVTTTVPAQKAAFTFAGTAGQPVGIGVRNLVLSSGAGSATMTITQPSGAVVGNTETCSTSSPGAGCNFWWGSLPQTGTYTVTVTPTSQATIAFDLTVSQLVTTSLTAGVPLDLDLSVWGRWALSTFTAPGGQTKTVTLDSIVTSPVGQQVFVGIYDSNWNLVTSSSSTTTRTYTLTNLAAGTYKIAVVPWYGATATARLTVN